MLTQDTTRASNPERPSCIQGQMLRLSTHRDAAIYLRNGRMWVAEFIDGQGTLVDATTWFRFNCGTLANSHALRRMALESAIPLSPGIVERLEALHLENATPSRGSRGPLIETTSQNRRQPFWQRWGRGECAHDTRNTSTRRYGLGWSTTAVHQESVMTKDEAMQDLHQPKRGRFLKASLIALALVVGAVGLVTFAEHAEQTYDAAAASAQTVAPIVHKASTAVSTRLIADDYLSSNLDERMGVPASTPRECDPEKGTVTDCTY